MFALEAWYALRRWVREPVDSPSIGRTWTELHPTSSLFISGITAGELRALDDWLALVRALARHDRAALERLGFYGHDQQLLAHVAIEAAELRDDELRPLAETVLARMRELSPSYGGVADAALRRLERTSSDQRWWVPEDIAAPPSSEPVAREREGFTREDVERVLSDL